MGNFELYSAAGLNSVEALVWVTIGVLLLLSFKKLAANSPKKDGVVLGILFVAFGASDVVEVYSGAWWRPWWLLIWKTLNATGLLYFTGKLYIAERADRHRNEKGRGS